MQSSFFPEKGMSEREIRKLLDDVEKSVSLYTPRSFGRYSTKPHPLAREIIYRFSEFNRSNAGTHTREQKNKQGKIHSLEREVIFMLGDLMGSTNVDGYITQGGSEGNLMGLWIGRNKIISGQHKNNKVCLLKTSLSHFSVDKAADILGLSKVIDVELDDQYRMSPQGLSMVIEELCSQGWKNFLIILTLGYVTTGTIDPIAEIDLVIRNLKKKFKINIYMHLDAAIGGLVFPFVQGESLNFCQDLVESISLDMHKTGFVPFTAGIFLCRKNLQRYVERSIKYSPRTVDDTVSGSRPSTTAVACWSVLKVLGREGFREIIANELSLRDHFISLLEQNKRKLAVEYIFEPRMNMAAFFFSVDLNNQRSFFLEKEYRMRPTSMVVAGKKRKVYTMIFMPHVSKYELDRCVNGLCNV